MTKDEFKKLLAGNGISISVSEKHLLEQSEANEMEYILDHCLDDVLDVINERNKLRQVYYTLHDKLNEYNEIHSRHKWSFVQQFYNGFMLGLIEALNLLTGKETK